MVISLIAAVSENNVIGDNNALPWHLPEEWKYFKKKTLGKPIIMGRKTFASLGYKPLPNRQNIILTQTVDFNAQGCLVVHSLEEALKAADDCEEVMIIGGAKVYEAFLPIASRLYITVVHQLCEGDTFFPAVDWKQWKIISEQKMDGFTAKVFEKNV